MCAVLWRLLSFSVVIPTTVVLTKVITSGVVGRMAEKEPEYKEGLGAAHPTRATRPVVTPDIYIGDSSWTDWADHFEAV